MILQALQTVLVIVAFVLPVAGLWNAFRKIRDRFREGSRLWERVEVLTAEAGGDLNAAAPRIQHEIPPSSTNFDVLYLRELIVYLIANEKVDGLRRDAIMVLVGLVAGVAADLIGVWVVSDC
jgi:hypothetical protein